LPDLSCNSHGKWRLALLGAALLVAAYAAARLLLFVLPSYAAAAVAWLPTVMGLVTVAYAGGRALLADDVRDGASHVLMATAGQIMLGIGLGMQGRPQALAGALGLLVPLAIGAPLLAAGIAGDPAIRVWSDLRAQRAARARIIATIAAAWTLAGLPPLAGFAAQRAVAEAAWHAGSVPLLLAALIAPALILAHGARAIVRGVPSHSRPTQVNGQRWQWWWVG
jgi:formate hydrogenlyase subunit 3/multisubunit Na+/H+ antiporter MnhD subunit